MSRIKLTDSTMSAIVKISDGNPGAATALMEMLRCDADPDDFLGPISPIFSLDSHEIYGSDIYVLWNDICERDSVKTIGVLRSVQLGFFPEDTLKKACAKQDYSGKNMIPVDELMGKVRKRLPNFKK